uniref:TIR domain-containing protein n=1 Tax=Candidatus Kentrum sp. TUN TaxID=2126343 RepID=A0A450ZQ48_9GAMM|nr:MAG: TIR domain-containing protein [Candidatus Kentron sp. TUN]VFK61940.1 MAG: TIR domain-containing protein [Candidatus Kentron sp. TUN]
MPDRSISKPSPSRRSKPAEGKRFAAFISYKHVSSTSFAAQLERTLKSYAKPLLTRPRKIFRDENYLAPGVDLPRLIKEALDNSEFLLLLASPESAQSPWVQSELDLWCRVFKRQEQLIVILLDGAIAVDDQSKQIDWSSTDALPTFMAEHLTTVPLYLDLRKLANLEDLSLREPDFKRAINGIVARFRGIEPNEMLGEEILQYRRNRRLRNGAVAALAMLTMLSGTFWFLADSARKEAEHSLANSYWASGISAEEKNDPVAAAHFFARATQKYSDETASKTGRLKLQTTWRNHNRITLDALLNLDDAEIIEYSADGSRILTWSRDNTARLWNVEDGTQLLRMNHDGGNWGVGGVWGGEFSGSESRILTWSGGFSSDKTARLWNVEDGAQVLRMDHDGNVQGAEFSADGSRILTWGDDLKNDNTARLWSVKNGAQPTIMHHDEILGARFSADGSRILTWGEDGTVRLWQAGNGTEVLRMHHYDGIQGARFSADGSRILSWSLDSYGPLVAGRGRRGSAPNAS